MLIKLNLDLPLLNSIQLGNGTIQGSNENDYSLTMNSRSLL